MELCEQLDMFSSVLACIYGEAEKQWASENPRVPQFLDGSAVLWRGKPATVHHVSGYRPQCYMVWLEGMDLDHYYQVPFEDVYVVSGSNGHSGGATAGDCAIQPIVARL